MRGVPHNKDPPSPGQSLSQKSETPKVVEFWMLVFARVTVLSAVFPPFSLHKTLESVCPASREPSQGTFETTSGQEKGARSKTTQGEGMRSSSSWIWHR